MNMMKMNLLLSITLWMAATVSCKVCEKSSRGRSKRHVSNYDADHKGAECFDETDPLFYVSKFHEEVCKSSVEIAFRVFYERKPNESEEDIWTGKCINKEIDESYMLYIFSNAEEHILKEASVPENEESHVDDEDHNTEEDVEEDQATVGEEKEKEEEEVDQQTVTTEAVIEEGNQNNGNNEEDYTPGSPEDEAKEPPIAVVPLELKMTNKVFSEDLCDPKSEEYKKLSKDVSLALVGVLRDMPGFKGIEILGFGNGSIMIYWQALFDETEENLPGEATDATNPQSQQELNSMNIDDMAQSVKEVIADAFKDPEIQKEKFTNTILSDATVDTESMKVLNVQDVEKLLEKNPEPVLTTVDMIKETKSEEIYHHRLSTSQHLHPEIETDEEDVAEERDEESSSKEETQEGEDSEEEEAEDGDRTEENEKDESMFFEEEDDEYSDDYFDDEEEEPSTITPTTTATISSVTYEILEDGIDTVEYPLTTTITTPVMTSLPPSMTTTVFMTSTETVEGSANEESGSGISEGLLTQPITMNQVVCLKLRVTNMNYTTNLTNRNNPEFQLLEQKFTKMLYPLLQSMDGFAGMEVIGFGTGSLIVNNEIYFKDEVPTNVSDDVKDRINAAVAYFKYSHIDIDQEEIKVLKPEETDLCEFVQCSMYADCVVRTDYRAECQCRPGYISVDHSNCVEICDLDPGYCRNGGECQVVPGRGAVCRCQVAYNWAYEGERCENVVPRTVLLVSASTAVACLLIIALIVLTCYIYVKKRSKPTKNMDSTIDSTSTSIYPSQTSQTDFSGCSKRNPIYSVSDESSTDMKNSKNSSLNSSITSSSSGHSSNLSTSTSSFYTHENIGGNGPLPGNFNTPERFLHLKVDRYPQHKLTWHGNKEGRQNNNKPSSQWNYDDCY